MGRVPAVHGNQSDGAALSGRIATQMKSCQDVRTRRLSPKLQDIAATAAVLAARAPALAEDSRSGRRKVLIAGLFPPPVDGQRLVTRRMYERLDAATMVARCDLDRFPRLGALSKPLSALLACLSLLAARLKGFRMLYLAPHSGLGLLYSCAIALVGRCAGYALAIHYHSYRNMARHSPLMAAFLMICGRGARHIVLAPPMARDLRRLYSSVQNVSVVSNTVFVEPRPIARRFGTDRLRLGHLSNLCREKGIAEVLQCFRALRQRGVDAVLRLAGPAADAETERLIEAAQSEFGERLDYFGRLGPSDVPRFYDEIDVFLFPTLHSHEAEPLVIVDAVAAGVPVVATERGCIGYLLGADAGCVFDAESYVARAAEQLALWASRPEALARASERAAARFRELHAASRVQLDHVIGMILDERSAPAPRSTERPRRATPPA